MVQLCKKLAEKRVFGPKLMADTTVAAPNHSTYQNLPENGILYIFCKEVVENLFIVIVPEKSERAEGVGANHATFFWLTVFHLSGAGLLWFRSGTSSPFLPPTGASNVPQALPDARGPTRLFMELSLNTLFRGL